MNAYSKLETVRNDLSSLIDREESKHLMDSDLVPGLLDLLVEALDVIDQCVYFDGS